MKPQRTEVLFKRMQEKVIGNGAVIILNNINIC